MAEPTLLDRDGWFKLEISTDCMEAYLILEPPVGQGKWPSKDKALETVRSEGIAYEENAVQAAVVSRAQRSLIAKGSLPQTGKDAEINIFFETGAFRREVTEDSQGKVDFRDLQTVQGVHNGDILAEKIPATAGEEGTDVRGRKISAIPGKDKPLVLGKNVKWSDEDPQKVVATGSGEPFYQNHRLSVLPIHDLKGNVNFESGNINFPGNLIVRGNVESGFKVEAEGDITIYGNVDSAEIRAGGCLYIQGGVSGMDKSELYSVGDMSAKYIERAKAFCQGNLTVREAIMHCIINVDNKITVQSGKGLIVGGLIRCGTEVVAKTIGSRLGTVTEIEVGVKPQIKQELQDVETRLRTNLESLDKAEKAIALLSKIPNLPPDRKTMLENLVKTSYALKAMNSDDETKRQGLIEEIVVKSKERGRIKVSEVIYPGVRVTIGKTTMPIQDEVKYTIVYYNEGEIQFQAYR